MSQKNREESICWTCARACPKTCSWSESFIPVEGWEAEYCEKLNSYSVKSCPLYENDRDVEWKLDEKGALLMVQRLLEVTRDDYIHCPRLQPEIERFLRGRGASKVHMLPNPETVIKHLKRAANEYQRRKANRSLI